MIQDKLETKINELLKVLLKRIESVGFITCNQYPSLFNFTLPYNYMEERNNIIRLSLIGDIEITLENGVMICITMKSDNLSFLIDEVPNGQEFKIILIYNNDKELEVDFLIDSISFKRYTIISEKYGLSIKNAIKIVMKKYNQYQK